MGSILVTGATGTFGIETARFLVGMGQSVRLFVRDPTRLPPDLKEAEVVTGTFGDDGPVERALDGVQATFLASFDSPDQLALQSHFVQAAQRAGAIRIVRVSTDHVAENRSLPLFGWHFDCERMLETSGLPYVHLRPSWVMQNFLSVPSVTRGRDGRIRVPARDGRAGFVDARDIAAVAAIALTGGAYDGTALEMTGPELLSHGDLASTFSAVTGLSITYDDLSEAGYRSELGGLGIGEQTVDTMLSLFEQTRRGDYASLTDTVQRVTGRPPISLARFAADHADRLKKRS